MHGVNVFERFLLLSSSVVCVLPHEGEMPLMDYRSHFFYRHLSTVKKKHTHTHAHTHTLHFIHSEIQFFHLSLQREKKTGYILINYFSSSRFKQCCFNKGHLFVSFINSVWKTLILTDNQKHFLVLGFDLFQCFYWIENTAEFIMNFIARHHYYLSFKE